MILWGAGHFGEMGGGVFVLFGVFFLIGRVWWVALDIFGDFS